MERELIRIDYRNDSKYRNRQTKQIFKINDGKINYRYTPPRKKCIFTYQALYLSH